MSKESIVNLQKDVENLSDQEWTELPATQQEMLRKLAETIQEKLKFEVGYKRIVKSTFNNY